LILQSTDDMSTLLVKSKGSMGNTYDDFYDEITVLNNAVGLVWMKVEETMTLFVSIYAGDGAKQEFLDVMEAAGDEIQSDDLEGIGVTLGYAANDLVLENVLQKNK